MNWLVTILLIPLRFLYIFCITIAFLFEFYFSNKTKRIALLVQYFETLGGTFIKVGQLLSLRVDFLPLSYCEALSKLQNQPKPFSYKKGIKIIEKELAKPIKELFSYVDEKLFASGSVSQIYKAKDFEGHTLIIKVRRPSIRRQVIADIFIVKIFILPFRMLGLNQKYGLNKMADEIKKILLEETDFIEEVKNLEIFKYSAKSIEQLVIPKVYKDKSTERIITMDLLEGISLQEIMSVLRSDNQEHLAKLKEQLSLSPAVIAMDLFEIIMKLIFENGFYHGDPHAGNIILNKDGKIGLLDFGAIGSLDPEMLELQIKYFQAISTNQLDDAVNYFTDILVPNASADINSFKIELKKDLFLWMMKLEDDTIEFKDKSMARLMVNATQLARKYSLRLPSNILLFFRVFLLVEPIFFTLKPDFNLKNATEAYLKKWYAQNYLKELEPKRVLLKMHTMAQFMIDLPDFLINKIEEEPPKIIQEKRYSFNNILSILFLVLACTPILIILFFDKTYLKQISLDTSHWWGFSLGLIFISFLIRKNET